MKLASLKRQSVQTVLAVLLSAGLLTPATASVESGHIVFDESNVGDRDVVHVLNRLTFGPRPGDIAYVKRIGIRKFIAEQLNPQSLPESPAVQEVDAESQTAKEPNEDLLRIFKSFQSESTRINQQRAALEGYRANNPDVPLPAEDMQHPMRDYIHRAQQHFMLDKLTREVESPRQLQAVMEDFWFNHFNIYLGKEFDGVLIESYERDAIRPHALGRFRDLLGATCHHPAMLFYLDNSQNRASGKVNENYARELMELHTLGVDGGYTQQDVIQLARILTGLTIATFMPTGGLALSKGLMPVGRSGAYFNIRQHDPGDKTLLGFLIKGSGEEEIEEALDILARHPSTAHHVCYQLAQYFVCDNPPKQLVDRLSTCFLKTDGNIKDVLSTLFDSPEFWDKTYYDAKYKSPLRYAVSALRAVDAHLQKSDSTAVFLNQQGEKLYGCITPDGYKNTKSAWLDPEALLKRVEFAISLGSGKRRGVQMAVPDYRELETTIGTCNLSSGTLNAVESAPAHLRAAAVLSSPEFMRF